MKEKIIIGKSDIASFPELEIDDIHIKVDTGAYTSSIHSHQISLDVKNDKKIIKFKILDPTHPLYVDKVFTTENFSEKKIKNSFGKTEKRFIINTQIQIFEKTYPIELSLSERGEMRYPVLIGRKLLNGNFIVDTSKTNLSKNKKIKSIKI